MGGGQSETPAGIELTVGALESHWGLCWVLPIILCVTLSQVPNFFELLCPHLHQGDKRSLHRAAVRVKWTGTCNSI